MPIKPERYPYLQGCNIILKVYVVILSVLPQWVVFLANGFGPEMLRIVDCLVLE
jgi:hypothetical protein